MGSPLEKAGDAVVTRLGRGGFAVMGGPGMRRGDGELGAGSTGIGVAADPMILEEARHGAEGAQQQAQ